MWEDYHILRIFFLNMIIIAVSYNVVDVTKGLFLHFQEKRQWRSGGGLWGLDPPLRYFDLPYFVITTRRAFFDVKVHGISWV